MVVDNQLGNFKRAVGVFTNYQATEQSLTELKDSGFPMEKVSVIAKRIDQETEVSGAKVTDKVGNQDAKAPMGVVNETLGHSAWAGVLVGLTALTLPSIGPILAAGGLATALVAGAASTGVSAVAAANLVKALTELGIPQAQAQGYSDRLIQGDALVVLEGNDDEINRAADILNQKGIRNWGVFDSP